MAPKTLLIQIKQKRLKSSQTKVIKLGNYENVNFIFKTPIERNKQDMESLGMIFVFYGGQQRRTGTTSQQILGQGSG